MHASSLAGWLAGWLAECSVVQCSAAEAGRPWQAGKDPPSSLEPERIYRVPEATLHRYLPTYLPTLPAWALEELQATRNGKSQEKYWYTYLPILYINGSGVSKVSEVTSGGSSEVAFPHCGMLDCIQGIPRMQPCRSVVSHLFSGRVPGLTYPD
ncbi:uncharacterized protein RSE6_01635 [Rhynchosporium secalis]|uniref:Uncharacterized protein n=1 Tax=Rhynchosporium secalis TaxID=38038 RepID=A0A1E1LYB5_RHYSE|nr:uncharacterized protein RSE6_01635 [Rhynchosporium secalis]